MDAQYLKETVGEALIEALDKVLDNQPADPIEYLGLMLLQYIKNQEGRPETFKRQDHKSYKLTAKDDKAEKIIELEQRNEKVMKSSSIEGQSETITNKVDVTETHKEQLENGLVGKEIKEGNSTDEGEVIPIPETDTLSPGVDAVVEEVEKDTTTHDASENGESQGNPTSEEPAVEVESAESNMNTAEAMDSIQGREDDITSREPTGTQVANVEGDQSTMPVNSTE